MKLPFKFHPFLRGHRTTAAVLCFGVFVCGSTVSAKPIPGNLGYGLDKLVESDVALRSGSMRRGTLRYDGYATEEAARYAQSAIMAEDGRVKVTITLSGKVQIDAVRQAIEAKFGTFELTALDRSYRGVGVLEGWLAVPEATGVSQVAGVRAVFLAHKPRTSSTLKAGAAAPAQEESSDFVTVRERASRIEPRLDLAMLGTKFLQGVTQHRVDKISQYYNPSAPVNYDGTGITVGVLSDSFATRPTNTAANPNMTTNVNNFDLPGHANNPVNTQPVVVLEDYPNASDEGRGMAEIVYKMAPKSKIGFATAFTGEVGFANNIRALSGRFPSVPNTRGDFMADVIVDDVGYGGEPVFSDGGIIAGGVDDVAAVGVAYFSSAANSYGVSVYNSDLRIVPNDTSTNPTGGLTAADNAALVGTNINLTGVPTELYQGGFHNFNPASQDVACLWNIGSAGGASTEMQWDDPYDMTAPVVNEPPIYQNTGTISTEQTSVTFTDTPAFSAGTKYVINVNQTSGNIDAIVDVIEAGSGNVIIAQDTGIDEVVTFFPPASGTYHVRVRRYQTTTGTFSIKINTAEGAPGLTTDLNLLVFRADNGAYIGSSSLTSNNVANNRPVELGTVVRPTGQTQVQFVIARASVPTAPRSATRVWCSTAANSNANNAPAEYFDYNSSVTRGHATAAGSNGVAAYDVFRPNVPQNFTSGGPTLIYFDRNNNLLPTPEVRLQPRMAAANGANSTWTGGDSSNDLDTGNGQFYGTSAAAPHAAAVAALVLQAKGGPGSVTPTQMTSILQRSVFPHDLDPYQATGVARASNGGKVTVMIRSDNTAVQNRGRNDANSHSIAYVGPSSITSFVFNPNGVPSEGGGVTSGQNGVDANNDYFSNLTPGLYFTAMTATGNFPFTVGNSSGLLSTDVAMTLSNPAPAPASQTAGAQGQTLTLSFSGDSFTGGDIFRFTIGRALVRGPNVAAAGGAVLAHYNADLYGGGVLIPEGTVIQEGMRFSGTLADGATFQGVIRNRLGFGFSQLDGFGFINAEAAVNAPIQ